MHLNSTHLNQTQKTQYTQSLVVNKEEYQHILRILNTNVEGGKPAPIALTKIRGIGKRFATLICRKAEIDIRKRSVVFMRMCVIPTCQQMNVSILERVKCRKKRLKK